MSKFLENIYTLKNNTFIFFPYIVEFHRTIKPRKNSILLSYLLFPLILNNECLKKIESSIATSSIQTFLDNQNIIAGLHDRIEAYKELTNNCILYANNLNHITIENDLSITVHKTCYRNIKTNDRLFKTTKNLEKIFKELDVNTIFKLMGIKQL